MTGGVRPARAPGAPPRGRRTRSLSGAHDDGSNPGGGRFFCASQTPLAGPKPGPSVGSICDSQITLPGLACELSGKTSHDCHMVPVHNDIFVERVSPVIANLHH